jgi:acyl carrier protein
MSSHHHNAAELTPTEQHIADAWSEVLDVRGLGGDSDFFALGGTSYQVVQVVTMLEEALGMEMPVRFFFQQPTTVAGLAQRIEVVRWQGAPDGSSDREVGQL